MAADASRAFAGLENSAQHPNHGCFSGTVRAEKPEDRSFSDRERNVIDSRECAEALRQPSTSIIGSAIVITKLGTQRSGSAFANPMARDLDNALETTRFGFGLFSCFHSLLFRHFTLGK